MEVKSPHIGSRSKTSIQSKKDRKIRHKLINDGLVISCSPTCYVAVICGGLGNGVSVTQLTSLFSKLGLTPTIHSINSKSYACAQFDSTDSAALAVSKLQGSIVEKTMEKNQHAYLRFLFISDSSKIEKSPALRNDTEIPSGLLIYDDFLKLDEEVFLLKCIEDDFKKTTTTTHVHEKLKNRSVLHFGYQFRYGTNDVDIAAPLGKLPDYINEILDKLLEQGYFKTKPDQVTVNKYEPGDGISSHIDNPNAFGDTLATVSLGATTTMEMNCGDQTSNLVIKPRTLMLFTGDSRYKWSHGIRSKKFDIVLDNTNSPIAVKRETRTSLTFRKVVHSMPADLKIPNNEYEANNIENNYVHSVYNKIADHFSSTREKPWPKVVEFLNCLDNNSFVLDVGCGSGRYLTAGSKNFVVGCDYSTSLVNVCKEKQCNVFACDALNIPVRSSVFDACICIAMLHHLSTKGRRLECINELLRVIKPKGKLLLYVWAADQKFDNKSSSYLKSNANVKKAFECSPPCDDHVKTIGIHQNRTNFAQQDLLVPWKLKKNPHSVNGAETTECNSTHYRFYHVFKQNELDELCQSVSDCNIIKSYYDNGNWAVVLQKISL